MSKVAMYIMQNRVARFIAISFKVADTFAYLIFQSKRVLRTVPASV